MNRVILVGENNPYGGDPRYALYPEPANSAGGRLCRLVLGLTVKEYLRRFERVNLLQRPKWSARAARDAAACMLVEKGLTAKFVLLGRKVFDAFSAHVPDDRSWAPFVARGQFLMLPHPSGLCRIWSEPGRFAQAREAVRDFTAEPLVSQADQVEEGFCPKRADGTHCVHWWDGDAACCDCGHGAPEVKA